MPLAVCATPIGNLDDVTLRVLAELRAADVVLAEDTRHTRGLLERHGISARLLSYHEHNEAARVAELLPRLANGERIALVSDAGLPGDLRPRRSARPGRARRPASRSPCCPGRPRSRPRSSRAAWPTPRYLFLGFLPRRAGELAALWRELDGAGVAGGRVRVPAAARRRRFARSRTPTLSVEVAVCRELTKRFEEVVVGSAAELAERFTGRRQGRGDARPRPGAGASGDPAAARAAVAELVAAGTPRRVAADVVARLTDTARNDLYRTTL